MSDRILRSLRELTETFSAFEALSRAQLRELALTSTQFDIIATLGNTAGMNFKDLGQRSLITKGTLTGVIDRLERDGLVERVGGQSDGRTVIVRLTAAGEELFDKTFGAIVHSTHQAFNGLTPQDLDVLDGLLQRLRKSFRAHESVATKVVIDSINAKEKSR